jgi:diadenosine tetraphosphate (Ap4A) HIT family hydrolase
MALVAEAVYKAFKPKKLNYELEGNSDHHLHWHLFPRYGTDPHPETVTWVVDKTLRYSETAKPNDRELSNLKNKLLKELNKLI